ncbi:hypothetical protein KL942_005105 [Ogataea angusta]|uniref:Uncharacterized protein n=1 Tax=Pichia angusta TaxID=870730 RepID=A0ABQ7RQ17_PICAN|nr:hypothetical protein KL920_005261 [Ogataea angusta]KAG7835567.1 hypothetical protein KL942_005105 [Ogataea angusta]KAG7845665.1 hypothetical protein KL940_005065 [Ogataea angusta]KAG7854032.1 hypothetical protein KL919_005302 [Ogataea angusta]
MAVGASRSELLEWINTTYQLKYTKIEQCGNGAVYCQIFDSIFGDLPMGKVNFNPTSDYQTLTNYKILQSGFSRHKITREVPVERLMKCRLQDNLEFLQWMSRLWSENKLDDYDPTARRKAPLPPSTAGTSSGSRRVFSNSSANGSHSGSRRTSLTGSAQKVREPLHSKPTLSYSSSRVSSGYGPGIPSGLQDELKNLRAQAEEMKLVQESLETERNFYFNKLRDIEILTQNLSEKLQNSEPVDVSMEQLVSHIQEILYSTTEGFQIPSEDQTDGPGKENDIKMGDEETF